MTAKNLIPGQFQIGSVVMGPRTLYSIGAVDIGNYDVNVQDSQAMASNDIKFGQDTLKPSPLQLTINLRKNYQLANVSALLKKAPTLNFSNDPTLGTLQREWRAEEVMQEWGATKPLYFCGSDGVTRAFYGRPGKFAYKLHRLVNSQYYECQAEFRRLDTFSHSDDEYFTTFTRNVPKTVALTRGNAKSWLRFLIKGPANHPIINFGGRQLELDWNIAANRVVEISSYPWSRRIVDDTGLSLAAYLISDNPYLDKLWFPNNTSMQISWNATGTTSASAFTMLWRDAYQVLE